MTVSSSHFREITELYHGLDNGLCLLNRAELILDKSYFFHTREQADVLVNAPSLKEIMGKN